MPSKWDGYVRSRDKLNTLYLRMQKTHEYESRQGAELRTEAAILKVTWPFDHVTIWKNYISTITRAMACIHGRVLTYASRFSTQTLKLSPTSYLIIHFLNHTFINLSNQFYLLYLYKCLVFLTMKVLSTNYFQSEHAQLLWYSTFK